MVTYYFIFEIEYHVESIQKRYEIDYLICIKNKDYTSNYNISFQNGICEKCDCLNLIETNK